MFRNAMIWDGTGADAFPADLLVDNGRIVTIARTPGQMSGEGATTVE